LAQQAVSLANVSFLDAVATFPQFVRYLGRRLDKDVRLDLVGEDVQLDRQIVDLLREPLRHLLVNAVDHGIEPPDVRVATGKPATGTVTVSAQMVDDRVEVVVADDGAGVDWEVVAEAADEQGLPVMPPDLTPLLFFPGFSTSDEVTDFSGSGEGLAAVYEAAEQVNGSVHIASRPGEGTTVTMTLPLSMVLQNVVIIAVGDEFWGLPEAAVEAAMPLSKAEIIATASGRELKFHSTAIPCVSLSQAVGAPQPPDESELLVVHTRSGLLAVTVSELVDRRRVAVKNLGPILEGVGHITGAALLGGGQVLVVLDPNFLGAVARQRPRLVEDKPRVLVVDDSAGVRQLLSATLNGAGFEVEVAASARDALLALLEDGFDAMVVDYSMPRSNGVELVRSMRAAEVKVPIVMVSGVATEAEKRAAWEVGVDAYLDKFDLRQGVLTTTLRQLMGLEEANEA
jgi:chemotaxis protein histidine kinase CheA